MTGTVADAVWACLLLLGIAYEIAAVVAKRWKDTLSDTTRKWFMTNTTAGRWGFGVFWVGFSGWYLWHILWQ